MNRKSLFIPYIPIIIGIATAEIYLIFISRRANMPNEANGISIEGIIAIVVALLGVAGGIWAQFVQFKKDAKRIDDVNGNVSGVKSDTSEMKPQMTNVNDNVKKIRDEVVEKLVPSMGKLRGIDTLVKAHDIEQAIKREISPNLYDKDTLKGTIDLVYEENARLQTEKKDHLRQLHLNKLEIDRLTRKISSLEQELESYQEQEPQHEQTLDMHF